MKKLANNKWLASRKIIHRLRNRRMIHPPLCHVGSIESRFYIRILCQFNQFPTIPILMFEHFGRLVISYIAQRTDFVNKRLTVKFDVVKAGFKCCDVCMINQIDLYKQFNLLLKTPCGHYICYSCCSWLLYKKYKRHCQQLKRNCFFKCHCCSYNLLIFPVNPVI